MTLGEQVAYDAYWEMSEALEEAGVSVEPDSVVEMIVRCTATQIGDLTDAFSILTDE